ncbi:MAG: 50S ribosomal protein L25 [Spirochaetaceae bacterium]|nr:50S ribosomal protein L25 [Spirochaetaceae bacterium]
MEVNTLAVETRTILKKGTTKTARKNKNIPAVVYGRNTPKHILVNEREFEKKFHKVSENTIITLLEKDNKLGDVLIKDYQEDLRTQKIMHIDFFEVDTYKKLRTNVPILLAGTAVGVKAGGILEHLLHTIEVECFPKDIPEKITVNIENLEIGDSIYFRDLEKIDNVKFHGQEDALIVHVIHFKAVTEEPAAAEAAATETPEAAGAAPKAGGAAPKAAGAAPKAGGDNKPA